MKLPEHEKIICIFNPSNSVQGFQNKIDGILILSSNIAHEK